MYLNLVPLVYRDFTIVVFGIISAYLMIRAIKKDNNIHFKPFLAGILLYSVYPFIRAFALLLMNPILHKIGYIFFVIGVIYIISGLNYISSENPSTPRLLLVSIIGSMAFAFAWLPGTSSVDEMFGFLYFNYSGLWMIFGLLFEGLFMIFVIEFFIRATIAAPKSLKKTTITITLVIAFYTVLNATLTLIPRFSEEFLPITVIWTLKLIAEISLAIVPFVFLLILIFNPSIMFILPFVAYRITVIRLKGGYSIFNHIWTESKSTVIDDLLAGLFSALGAMSEQILQVGLIKEIKFEKGILLFVKGKYVMVGLLSSKASRYLRTNLNLFTNEFEKTFEAELNSSSISERMFDSAKILVSKYYKNIPARI
ncbi:MAG: hypothetical protein ACXQS8_03830 [Candidatus Helarchaeales archaeon]